MYIKWKAGQVIIKTNIYLVDVTFSMVGHHVIIFSGNCLQNSFPHTTTSRKKIRTHQHTKYVNKF